jgi:hypothetical protein
LAVVGDLLKGLCFSVYLVVNIAIGSGYKGRCGKGGVAVKTFVKMLPGGGGNKIIKVVTISYDVEVIYA